MSGLGSTTNKELTVKSLVEPLQVSSLDSNGERTSRRYVMLSGVQLPMDKLTVTKKFEGTVHQIHTQPPLPPGVLKAPNDSNELSYLKESKEEESKHLKQILIPGRLYTSGM